MHCNIRSKYFYFPREVLQKQKVNVHLPLFSFAPPCVYVECPFSLSFFRCSPRLQPTTARNGQPGTDRSNHKRALPGASTVAVEDGWAQKRKHARSSQSPWLSGRSPTCYVTVDQYPGSGQRCQAGMMPRELVFTSQRPPLFE